MGLRQIQKQPHSNANINNGNAESDKEKDKMTKYHLTPEPNFEEKDIKKPRTKQKIVSKSEPVKTLMLGVKPKDCSSSYRGRDCTRTRLAVSPTDSPRALFSHLHPDPPPYTQDKRHRTVTHYQKLFIARSSLYSMPSSVSKRFCWHSSQWWNTSLAAPFNTAPFRP